MMNYEGRTSSFITHHFLNDLTCYEINVNDHHRRRMNAPLRLRYSNYHRRNFRHFGPTNILLHCDRLNRIRHFCWTKPIAPERKPIAPERKRTGRLQNSSENHNPRKKPYCSFANYQQLYYQWSDKNRKRRFAERLRYDAHSVHSESVQHSE
jgi:hypothetical protein